MLTLLVGPLSDGIAYPALIGACPCEVQEYLYGPPSEIVLIDSGPWVGVPVVLDDGPAAALLRAVSFEMGGTHFEGVELEVSFAGGAVQQMTVGEPRRPVPHTIPFRFFPGYEDPPSSPVLIPSSTLELWRRCAREAARCRQLASDEFQIKWDACMGQILQGGMAGGAAVGSACAGIGALGGTAGVATGGVVGCVVGFGLGAWFLVDRCHDEAETSLKIDMNRCRRQERWCIENGGKP